MRAPRLLFRAALLALIVAAGTNAAQAQLDPRYDPKRITTSPLRSIPTVKPERLALPNGMVVFLLENHDLPVVTGSAFVRTTPAWVPADRVGLGTITGQVMRSGGTAEHSGDWLDDRLGAIGASMWTNVSSDLASAGFRCLSDDAPELIGLLAEILRAPAFPDDKIELARVGLRREIAGRNDEMIPLLVRVAGQAVYGKDSPWARQPEYATLEAVEREDCVALHRQVFEPSRMVLAVYGDFSSAAMKKLLKARLGAWKGAGTPLPPLPPSPTSIQPRLVFAPKQDVTQSGIILTAPGFRADDPDYPAMDVLNTALGGGFQSRLVNRIRTERGLAYATGATAGEDYQRPGVFVAYSLTKSESTMVALDLLREEVRKVTEAPLTDDELRIAKESVLNQFVFNFEEPSSVLFRAAFFEVIGYPQDFLQRYQRGVEAVTAQSVMEAAKRKLVPDRMAAVVVGKEQDFDRPLDSMGLALERVDISIPPPPSQVAAGEATPEALARGQEWLQQASKLTGGAEAWKGIKSATLEQQRTISMQGQSLSLTTSIRWVLPDRMQVVQKLPMGEMKQGFDGKNGWREMMGQVQDEPQMGGEVAEQYERSLFHLFGHPEAVQIQALPEPRDVDGVSHRVALVKSDRIHDWTLLFAPDGRLARMEYQGDGPQGPARLTEVYLEWNAAGPVQFPHAMKVLVDGTALMEGKLTAAKFNEELGPEVFRKPTP